MTLRFERLLRPTLVGVTLAVAALTMFGDALFQDAYAQTYPTRPITLVVPFATGGATDVVARLLGAEVAKTLGQPVVVDNKSGAAGAIGAGAVARSAPDGYTLCFCGGGPMVILKLLDSGLAYDPARDLAPVTLSHMVEYIVVVSAASPMHSLSDLVSAAKAKPDKLSYASTGPGGPAHLGMEYFAKLADIHLIHVPYRGESAEIADLLGDRVDIGLLSLQAADPLVKAGKVRALAVWGATRAKLFPAVPTVAESGYPGFSAGTFVGVNVAAGTPATVIDKLYRAFATALNDPIVQDKLLQMGFTPVGSGPEAYAAFLQRERVKWARVVQDLGAKARE